MSTHPSPRVLVRDLIAAAARLAGTIVLDLADMVAGPALYDPRLGMFRTLDGDDLGVDDGTLIVLGAPGALDELIAEHGTAAAAARVLTAEARRIASAS